jgi:ATP-binding cassette subfamily C protein
MEGEKQVSAIKPKKLKPSYILKRLFTYTYEIKKELISCVVGGAFGGIAKIVFYICAGLLLSLSKNMTAAYIGMILCCLAVPVTYYFEMFKGHDIAYHILAILRSKMFYEIERLSPAKLSGEKKGDIISTLVADVDTLEIFFAHLISPIVTAVCCTVFSLLFIASKTGRLALIVLPLYLYVGVISPYLISKAGSDKGRAYRKSLGSLKAYILDSLRGLKEVLIFNNGSERLTNIDKKSMEMNKLQLNITRQNALLMSVPSFILQISRVIAFGFCAGLLLKNAISSQDAMVLILMIPSTFDSLAQLSTSTTALIQTFGSAERVFAIIDEPSQVEDTGKIVFDGKIESVEFKNVSFAYPGTAQKVADNINLVVHFGDKVGINGPSGCGKTTMLHLLLRFYDPDEGEVLINGINIREYTLDSLRYGISIMEQDTYLFNDSLLNNIRIGKPEATLDEVENAAKRAGIHELIMSLPEGYETKAGELGNRLSGGERQRIGIARTILKNSDIMLFDEPTSNLDVLNEKGLIKTIDEEFADKTVFMISHRNSTLGSCNMIFDYQCRTLHVR